MKIETRDMQGEVNGYLVPIWSVYESMYRPDQVYASVVLPGKAKGPHLHKTRSGRFTCISGACVVIRRTHDGRYERIPLNTTHQTPVCIMPGEAAQIVCVGEESCILVNLPTPAWSKENPDDWPVEDWNPNV